MFPVKVILNPSIIPIFSWSFYCPDNNVLINILYYEDSEAFFVKPKENYCHFPVLHMPQGIIMSHYCVKFLQKRCFSSKIADGKEALVFFFIKSPAKMIIKKLDSQRQKEWWGNEHKRDFNQNLSDKSGQWSANCSCRWRMLPEIRETKHALKNPEEAAEITRKIRCWKLTTEQCTSNPSTYKLTTWSQAASQRQTNRLTFPSPCVKFVPYWVFYMWNNTSCMLCAWHLFIIHAIGRMVVCSFLQLKVFHCEDLPQFAYSFSCWWTFRLIPVWDSDE